jgi:outer membrane receptor for ferrienterochelin and colicins
VTDHTALRASSAHENCVHNASAHRRFTSFVLALALPAVAARVRADAPTTAAPPAPPASDSPAWTQIAQATPSEESLDALAELSLEDMLTAPTTVASARALTVRDSPGVITTITRDEMLASGARELLDVLMLVPGVFIGLDVEGTLGLGMRGLWGHEGKILFLLNGHTLNEMNYLTTQLGGRIPVELLERVEIIRGPGSVRYGGYAELAVVNIVTIGAEKGKQRAYASTNYGQMHTSMGRVNASVAYASNGVLHEDVSISIAAHLGKAHLSDERYYDLWGGSSDMGEDHRFRTTLFDVGLGFRDLELRYQAEDYRVQMRDGYDVVLEEPLDIRFLSHHFSAQYRWQAHSSLVITPRLEYHRYFPFDHTVVLPLTPDSYSEDELATFALFDYHRLGERSSVALRGDWDVLPELTLSLGSEFRLDRAEERGYDEGIDDLTYDYLYEPDELTTTFYNVAVFAEASTQNDWVNATLGARYEHHEQFGGAFVPRLALGKVFGDFHVKALAAQAFKNPGLENINLNHDIERERTTAFEVEVGYRVLKELMVTANAFDLTIDKPIVYFYDAETEREGYANYDRTGSRGAEAEVRYETPRVRVVATYALYTARHKNEVPDYAVPNHPSALLGAPNHKLGLNAHARLWRDLHGNATATFMTKRYAQVGLTPDEELRIGVLDPALLLNLFVEYRNLFMKGLAIAAGAYNVTGQRFSFPQPYTAYHASLPAEAREYLVRLSYAYD